MCLGGGIYRKGYKEGFGVKTDIRGLVGAGPIHGDNTFKTTSMTFREDSFISSNG